MHIGFLTTEYPISSLKSGGIGIFIKHISHLLLRKCKSSNISISILYWGNKICDRIFDDGISIIPISQPYNNRFSFYSNRKYLCKVLNKLINEEGLDIIETIDWKGPMAFCNLSVPIVTRLHGSNVYFDYLLNKETPWLLKKLESKALHTSTAYIGVSQQALNFTQKLFNLSSQKKTTVIYNPVDFDYISQFYHVNKNSSTVTILYFGTIVKKKGVFDIPLIFNELCKVNDNLKLKLIGRDTIVNGKSTWETCRSFFTSQALRYVEYLGYLPYDETLMHINEADICLFPNHVETFGLVLLEAMFMRKAIICSNIDCFQEIVDHDKDAIQCTVGNIKEFVFALQQLVNNVDKRVKLANNAYQKAITKFSTDIIVQQNLSFYEELLKNRSL